MAEDNNKEQASHKALPKVHKELEGFNIEINEFGEIVSTMSHEQLNAFLDKKVVDKKLKDREDLDVRRDEEQDETNPE